MPCTLFNKYVLNEFHGCQGGAGFEKVVSNCKQAHFKILFPEVHFFILKIKINKSVQAVHIDYMPAMISLCAG